MPTIEMTRYRISLEPSYEKPIRWPVAIESDGLAMRGEVVLPKERDKPTPIVLIIHGAGKEKPPLAHMKALQDALAKEGIASLAYESRGVGKSQGKYTDYTLTDRKHDALTAWQWAKKHLKGTIDENNVGVVAASMGGHVAARLTQELPAIKALALYEPAAYTKEAEDKQFGESFSKAIRDPNKDLSTSPAFGALENFKGNVFVAFGAADAVIPQEVKENYHYVTTKKRGSLFLVLPEMEHNLLSSPQTPAAKETLDDLYTQTALFFKQHLQH